MATAAALLRPMRGLVAGLPGSRLAQPAVRPAVPLPTKRKTGVLLTADGEMLIDLPDSSMTPGALACKETGPKKLAVAPKAARCRRLTRTSTPSLAVHKTSGRGPKPWARVALQPDQHFDRFRTTGCGVASKRSKSTYLTNLTTVRRICGGAPVATLLKNVDQVVQQVAAAAATARVSKHTHVGYLASLLAFIRHALPCATKASLHPVIERLQAAHKALHLQADQGALQNAASERQAAGWMSYSELCKVRDRLIKGSRARLLLAFATYVPPCRTTDLGCCRLYTTEPAADDPYTGNYIVLSKAPLICYRDYKTAKHYGEVRVSLPGPLVREINWSLQKQPRDWLFTQTKRNLGEPYCRASNAFTKLVNWTLQRVCNPWITWTLLRHIYTSHAQTLYDASQCKTEAEKALCRTKLDAIARAMLHSPGQQARYRFAMLQDKDKPAVVDPTKLQEPARPAPLAIDLLP